MAESGRSSRRRGGDKADRFAQLRAAKSGIARSAQYEVAEDEIYDLVSEDDYRRMVRDQMKEDTFIVDDDGTGYGDHGLEDWEGRRQQSSDVDDDDDDGGGGKAKNKKRKVDKEQQQQPMKSARIDKMLTKLPKERKLAPVKKPEPAPSQSEEADFMNNLLAEMEAPAAKPAASKTSATASRLSASKSKAASTKRAAKQQLPPAHTKSPFDTPRATLMSRDISDLAGMFDDEPAPVDIGTRVPETVVVDDDDDDTEQAAPEQPAEREPSPSAVVEVPEIQVRAVAKAKATVKVSIAPQVPKEDAPASLAPDQSGNRDWLAMSASLAQASDQALPPQMSSMHVQDKSHVFKADGSLDMFWIDAYERSGIVYLFGKILNTATQSFISCCVTVRNIERNLFFLPRPKKLDEEGHVTDLDVEPFDVYKEVNAMRDKLGIPTWRSKFVERKYAFEVPGIPQQTQWLKAMYSFSDAPFPANASGATFSHVFGTGTSALELFILKRKLMGPCWLNIKNAQVNDRPISWCRFEVVVDNPKDVVPYAEGSKDAPSAPPPLVMMCMNLKTVMNHQKNQNEIAAASLIVYTQARVDGSDAKEKRQPLQFTTVRQLNDMPFPTGFAQMLQESNVKAETQKTERALLSYILALIHKLDPDVLVGHNITGFDLDVLLHRMKHHKINTEWSKLGRLRRQQWPKLQSGPGGTDDAKFSARSVASGRLLCDTYLAAREFVRAKNYSLSNLSQTLLKVDHEDLDREKIPLYYNSARDLVYLLRHATFDAYLAGELAFHLQVLPLYKQLTNLAGNLWARTLAGGRAERNEYLLLHEFHKNKFVCPDKQYGKNAAAVAMPLPSFDDNEDNDEAQQQQQQQQQQQSSSATAAKTTSSRRKPAYAGGLVLEPKRGFYDHYVMLLDFNSLYPSIIQEYNICFTTVQRNEQQDVDDQLPEFPGEGAPPGILPKLIKTLVDRRKLVKGLMKSAKSPDELSQLNIRQMALKLTANSMYGCLGFTYSRFFAKPLAMMITAKGRDILQNTVALAEGEGMEVIYGDTDSIMVHTNSNDLSQVKAMGKRLKDVVNKRYRLLEIEMDGFFQRMLLLKKKKYAALVAEEKDGRIVTSMEIKGLDLVRRDWCGLSYDASNFVLQQMLSGDNREDVIERIHKYLTTLGQDVRQGKMTLDKFIIHKGLTKPPEAYHDAKSQPQVTVALRLKSRGESVRVGDTVPYVICMSPPEAAGANGATGNMSYAQRAFHPDEVRKDPDTHKIDFEWYLQQQVHPPVARLCEPMEGTDNARIADCLGLDASRYRHMLGLGGSGADGLLGADGYQTLDSLLSDEERFKDVVKWTVRCRGCGQSFVCDALARPQQQQQQQEKGSAEYVSGFTCPHDGCGYAVPLPSLVCQLTTTLRGYIMRYQNGWLRCDDQSCQNRSRSLSVYGRRCLFAPLCRGTVTYEYSAHQLYRQLAYFEHLFDHEKFFKKNANEVARVLVQRQLEQIKQLHAVVMQYLERDARRYVDLGKLFSFCRI
ncbi:DNA-directed DNA polymerase alpha catalytic subunit pol1 [Sorochytrium milnesiophthora]